MQSNSSKAAPFPRGDYKVFIKELNNQIKDEKKVKDQKSYQAELTLPNSAPQWQDAIIELFTDIISAVLHKFVIEFEFKPSGQDLILKITNIISQQANILQKLTEFIDIIAKFIFVKDNRPNSDIAKFVDQVKKIIEYSIGKTTNEVDPRKTLEVLRMIDQVDLMQKKSMMVKITQTSMMPLIMDEFRAEKTSEGKGRGLKYMLVYALRNTFQIILNEEKYQKKQNKKLSGKNTLQIEKAARSSDWLGAQRFLERLRIPPNRIQTYDDLKKAYSETISVLAAQLKQVNSQTDLDLDQLIINNLMGFLQNLDFEVLANPQQNPDSFIMGRKFDGNQNLGELDTILSKVFVGKIIRPQYFIKVQYTFKHNLLEVVLVSPHEQNQENADALIYCISQVCFYDDKISVYTDEKSLNPNQRSRKFLAVKASSYGNGPDLINKCLYLTDLVSLHYRILEPYVLEKLEKPWNIDDPIDSQLNQRRISYYMVHIERIHQYLHDSAQSMMDQFRQQK